MPSPLHQDSSRFSRTFFCFEMVDLESCRAVASAKNFVTASATVGISALTTPMSPDASQPRIRSVAASQDRRFSAFLMYSPRREPWTQMGQAALQPFAPRASRGLSENGHSGMCRR